MAESKIAALIVPHGKVLDFIDGTLRNETPEEYVRQEIEKSLVREYLYPRPEIRVEFRIKMGTAPKRVDLAVFPPGVPAKQETTWAICECKASSVPPDHRTEGVEQLKSYLAACANAEYGMWTNGQERFCYRKVRTAAGAWHFAEIADIPVKGRPPEEAERPTRASLKAAESDALIFAFRRCHNYIAANQGLQKAEAFWELLKLIFCKIEDERSDELRFYATTQEWQSLNGQLKVRERIGRLFNEVRANYRAIFEPGEDIELEPLRAGVHRRPAADLLAAGERGRCQGQGLRGDRWIKPPGRPRRVLHAPKHLPHGGRDARPRAKALGA